MNRAAVWVLFSFLCLLPLAAEASVEVTSHSYVHNPSGRVHVVLHLAKYKRGLFFGSCGPSTRSLQWECSIELTGAGPEYGQADIEVRDGDRQAVPLESGSVRMDLQRRTVTISLSVRQSGEPKPFTGNGTFKIKP